MEDLERILQHIDQNLYEEYNSLLKDLTSDIYPCINEALAVKNGIYTNHDKKHFDLVIKQAGYLLRADEILKLAKEKAFDLLSNEEKRVFFFQNSLELFILLCSIRVHDIGLIINREDHSTNILYTLNILKIMKIKIASLRLISEIASAHTGNSLTGTKDTIKDLEKITQIDSKYIRPQMLAAIVRFSDELEEGEHRTNLSQLKFENIQKENIVFHKYSLSMSNLSISHEDSTLNLTFEISENENEIYIKPSGDKVTLLEEIYNRLQKLEVERKYFQRFMCNSFNIEKINVKIHLVDEEYFNILKTISISTTDSYPKIEAFGLEDLYEEIEKNKGDA
ncbi:hypothetical protein [Halarcobacter sp.]|uniref:HD domain-containing protein n=1 Tax=Halarcobacter sp. TaxID=2321133 RepID=UPI002AA77747|nr:hypothetical protein [Halarcobacter sp.]